ncbi:transporter substrate-binding domain-containing protein [Pararhizobium sp. YC-54]|uniref:substrate-binding periplasmic protein n=1 Tax=Pararhizobium sp. YC-54 TaxID=2986920 RepID=UPI0021F776AC|nr:transporter substrate-binding domain-containing protein [Pararhizobium sp. YC-54]MCW0001495.1 transporter substrate-binding domain-containing protein [Pararhizobium sp. YC-54]
MLIVAAVAVAGFGATTAKAEDGYWDGVKKAGVLRCGAAIAAPYVMRDPATGEYSGFFSELCKEFAETLGVKAQFVDTNWDNIVAGLQASKWDMSMALNRTPTRALAIQYSNAPVDLTMNFVYNKKNPKLAEAPKSVSDIDKAGVTVAVMSGSAQDKALSAVLKSATVMRLPGNDEARLAVISKRADLVIDANDTNALFSQAHSDWAATLDPEPALSKQGVAFGVPHSLSYADIQVLNIFLEEKVATGHVKQLVDDATKKAAEAK